jgi:hypothetical protein
MMAHPSSSSTSSIARASFAATARQVYAREGLSGFFRGLNVCLLRAFPSNACAIFVYEGIMRNVGAEKVNDKVTRGRLSINRGSFATLDRHAIRCRPRSHPLYGPRHVPSVTRSNARRVASQITNVDGRCQTPICRAA